MTDTPFDAQRAHRWFAVECNNQTWDLVEAESRTPEQVEQMIHGAHAACFHWLAAGSLLNHLRAQNLLATAYVAAGLAEAAVRHAERCLALSQEAGDSQSAFDRATAHGCASAAYQLNSQADLAQQQYALAKGAADTLEEADDRALFDKLYPAPA